MNDLRAVTFRFGVGDYEVHYLSHLPEMGDFVTHLGELWTVASIEAEDVGGAVARCEPAHRTGDGIAGAVRRTCTVERST